MCQLKDRLLEWIKFKKKYSTIYCLTETHFKYKELG